MLTLGSLFDGIGGFPLVASWHGIETLWASEIDPACVSITRRHFPNMLHLGDITKINGAAIAPVDIITFGSPCQDLSVAGKRAGMKHEDKGDDETTRSGLFMEAIRIIREMRDKTNGTHPRIIVWENVPGAFSSNGGNDFRIVLEEICRTAEPGIDIPRYPDGWPNAGLILGDGYSVGWRQLDAQYWGVPQRRKRIYLVADFGGNGAGEILFKPESLRRHTSAGKAPWERFAGAVEGGAGIAVVYSGESVTSLENAQNQSPGDPAPTLNTDSRKYVARSLTARMDGSPCVDRGPEMVLGEVFNESGPGYWMPGSGCLRAEGENRPSRPSHIVAGFAGKASAGAGSVGFERETGATLRAGQEMHNAIMQGFGDYSIGGVAGAVKARDFKDATDLVVAGLDCRNGQENGDLCGTLQAKGNGGFSYNTTHPVRISNAVRRLTPIECARLQGYPDDWAACGAFTKRISAERLERDLAKGALRTGRTRDELLQVISDAAQYRAYGNSLALPCADYIISGVADILSQT